MATFALDLALDTRTGYAGLNLVLVKMAAATKTHFRNWIYCGHRSDLAAACEVNTDHVDKWLPMLADQGHIVWLDNYPDGEAWVCFPRDDLDLETLRQIWRHPTRAPKGRITKEMRLSVYRRDSFRCLRCGWAPPVADDYDGSYAPSVPLGSGKFLYLVLDHRTPLAAGGMTTVDNLQSLCGVCNSQKGALV